MSSKTALAAVIERLLHSSLLSGAADSWIAALRPPYDPDDGDSLRDSAELGDTLAMVEWGLRLFRHGKAQEGGAFIQRGLQEGGQTATARFAFLLGMLPLEGEITELEERFKEQAAEGFDYATDAVRLAQLHLSLGREEERSPLARACDAPGTRRCAEDGRRDPQTSWRNRIEIGQPRPSPEGARDASPKGGASGKCRLRTRRSSSRASGGGAARGCAAFCRSNRADGAKRR